MKKCNKKAKGGAVKKYNKGGTAELDSFDRIGLEEAMEAEAFRQMAKGKKPTHADQMRKEMVTEKKKAIKADAKKNSSKSL